MTLRLDHLAVSVETLEQGAAQVAQKLGVALQTGGAHALMGTHNRLLSLGPDCYLEVIAIDPDAPPPGRPRWFDLDHFQGPPRLTNWICASDDLAGLLPSMPSAAGRLTDFQRGAYRWQMAVPGDGHLPMDGAFPALIQWQGTAHPAPALADLGCRLHRLTILHPEAPDLARMLGLTDPRIAFETGPVKHLVAEIDTPTGRKVLE